jgi:hypothetical protein
VSRRGGVLLYLAAAAALLAAARPVEAHLARLRARTDARGYSLAAFAPSGGGRSAGEALSTAGLGGLRGIIADLLWMRAMRMEDQGRSYEIVVLLDGILRMQPHFTSVWVFQARVLAFDFGSLLENPDPAEAYRWVRRGIEVLEEGAARNRTSHLPHFALADIYMRKFSERSVDRQTWLLLLREWHAEEARRAAASGRPAPPFDRYAGLKLAREHFLAAAGKPDVSASRKLLCERLAIRCRERMGHWREAEADWAALVAELARPERGGPGSPVLDQHRRFFRQFLRYRAAAALEGGRTEESREVHRRMAGHFPGCPGYREVLEEEIRERFRAGEEDSARALFRTVTERLGAGRGFEEITGARGGRETPGPAGDHRG